METDVSDIGYGGILKQSLDKKESIVFFHSRIWNSTQKNYSTVKGEILSIVLCVQKFQSDLINKNYVIKTDSRASKFVLEKDVKNLGSKQVFARWQAILSCFNFQILSIKGVKNPLADYLSREFLLEKIFSLTTLFHLEMTEKKTVEKGKKPIASSNTPTPMTSDSYAIDAGFTLVTRSKTRLSKKQTEVITSTRPSASSTRSSAVTPSRPTVSSTS